MLVPKITRHKEIYFRLTQCPSLTAGSVLLYLTAIMEAKAFAVVPSKFVPEPMQLMVFQTSEVLSPWSNVLGKEMAISESNISPQASQDMMMMMVNSIVLSMAVKEKMEIMLVSTIRTQKEVGVGLAQCSQWIPGLALHFAAGRLLATKEAKSLTMVPSKYVPEAMQMILSPSSQEQFPWPQVKDKDTTITKGDISMIQENLFESKLMCPATMSVSDMPKTTEKVCLAKTHVGQHSNVSSDTTLRRLVSTVSDVVRGYLAIFTNTRETMDALMTKAREFIQKVEMA